MSWPGTPKSTLQTGIQRAAQQMAATKAPLRTSVRASAQATPGFITRTPASPQATPAAPGDPAPVPAADSLRDPTMPFDANSEQQRSGLQARHDIVMASIAARQALLDKTYGARDGNLDWVNPDDPWSRTGVLKRQWFGEQQARTASQFSNGSGYDGSSELRDALAGVDKAKVMADTQRSYQSSAGGLAMDKQDAATALETGNGDLLDQVAQRFGTDLGATVAPSSATTAPAAPAAPAAAPSAPKPKAKAKATVRPVHSPHGGAQRRSGGNRKAKK